MELMMFRGSRFIDSILVDKEKIGLRGYLGEQTNKLKKRNAAEVGEDAFGCDFYLGERRDIEQLQELTQTVQSCQLQLSYEREAEIVSVG